MARTVDQIYAGMVADFVTAMAAIGITIDPAQWGKRNMQRATLYTAATQTGSFEQLYAQEEAIIEANIASVSFGSSPSLQAQVFLFQFSDTNPQVVQFNTSTLQYYYPVVDPTLCIISRCTVNKGVNGTVVVKVATNDTDGNPAPLSTDQQSALLNYIETIAPPGIYYSVYSTLPDMLYCQAQVFYQGQYSAIIQASVNAAINNYLASIPFNGVITLSNLELAIRAVAGVNDVVFNNVSTRYYIVNGATYQAIGSNILALNNTVIVGPGGSNIQTTSGYIIGENSNGNTFSDTITYIAQ